MSSDTTATPKGLLGFADSPEDAAAKLAAVQAADNAATAAEFSAMFEPPAAFGPEAVTGGIAPTS
jgi:hypothetical protein